MNIWATIILWEGADPETDRIERKTDQETLTIVFANSVEQAADAARHLVETGTELIELCGGFGLDAGGVISRAVAGRCAVGVVSFGIESITQAAAYKARFEAGAAGG